MDTDKVVIIAISLGAVAGLILVGCLCKRCMSRVRGGSSEEGDVEMDGGMSTKIRHEARGVPSCVRFASLSDPSASARRVAFDSQDVALVDNKNSSNSARALSACRRARRGTLPDDLGFEGRARQIDDEVAGAGSGRVCL